MDSFEQTLVKLCEYCGFTYDPGPEPKPDEWYALEVTEIPYAEFDKKVIPGCWIRSIALHLHDTRWASEDIFEYLHFIPTFLKNGFEAMSDDWREERLHYTVADELRSHALWFITFSETLRDKIRWNLEDQTHHLVPEKPKRYKSSVPVKELSRWILKNAEDFDEEEAYWVARQMSLLDIHCKRTFNAIETFISEPEAPAPVLIQRFANVQAEMLEIGRVLIEADYATDLWDYSILDPIGEDNSACKDGNSESN